MTRITTFTIACGLAFAALVPAAAQAQGADTRDRTIMTFSGTAEMPGLTLQPGTYVFKLADTSQRNVVQVWDRDERNVLGQWLFVPAERRESTDETFVAFRETPAGTTPAIQYWYYPGQLRGKEFVYPKEQANRIARTTGQKVLTDEANATERVASVGAPEVPAAREPVTPEPEPRTSGETASTMPRESAAPRQSSTPAFGNAPPPPSPSPAPARSEPELQVARNELPQTASPLALTGIIALASIGASMTFRAMRRSRAPRA